MNISTELIIIRNLQGKRLYLFQKWSEERLRQLWQFI